MTEKQWLAGKLLHPMLEHLREPGVKRDRKLRLFAVACCRGAWKHLTDARSQRNVEVAERYADGLVKVGRLLPSEQKASDALQEICEAKGHDMGWVLRRAPVVFDRGDPAAIRWAIAAAYTTLRGASRAASVAESVSNMKELADNCNLLREIFGNLFRSVAFDPAWRTSDVLLLARGIYEERAFDRMPILADALQDAGCHSADILTHLRDPDATHVRGCWALDLVLEKA